jgi:hypothetical protein
LIAEYQIKNISHANRKESRVLLTIGSSSDDFTKGKDFGVKTVSGKLQNFTSFKT